MSTVHHGRSFEYAQVDVFAEHALEGNALGIFPDARGLSDEEMLALARETNLSETTFIVPRAPEVEREQGVQVRIFLTTGEVPFAGHPTLGTASWLYWNHPALSGAEEIRLELGVGTIPVRFVMTESDAPGVFGSMEQRDPEFGAVIDRADEREAVAAALSLPARDLDSSLPVQIVSTGMKFCIVPVHSLEALARVHASGGMQPLLNRLGARHFYCVTRSNDAGWRARMLMEHGEDPATGSAAGCTISWMVKHGAVESGQGIVIEQGVEMHRHSRIHASAALEDGRVTKVFVGGRTIPVAMGRFFLP